MDFIAKLPKHTGINNYFINLINIKQPFYDPIYSLKLLEFEILKTYIKINLANNFIRPSKLFANTPILSIYKKNSSFYQLFKSQQPKH